MAEDGTKTLVEYGVLGTVLAVVMAALMRLGTVVFSDHGAREKRLSDRIEKLESTVETTLFSLIKADSEVIQRCIEALDNTSEALKSMTNQSAQLMHTIELMKRDALYRPCLLPDDHPAKAESRRRMLDIVERKDA